MTSDEVRAKYPAKLVDLWIVAGAKRYEARKNRAESSTSPIDAKLKKLDSNEIKQLVKKALLK